MTKTASLTTLVMFLTCTVAFAGETIIAREVEGYFYADGEMQRSAGQFQNTYYIEGNTITRLRVYDFKKNQILPDDTVYRIVRKLTSDPSTGLYEEKSVIRAIGQPGLDAIEILVISETFIQSVRSTWDYFVISRLKRIK